MLSSSSKKGQTIKQQEVGRHKKIKLKYAAQQYYSLSEMTIPPVADFLRYFACTLCNVLSNVLKFVTEFFS